MATPSRRNGDRPFIVSRTFAAPRQRVWRAWTDRDELRRWFGPTGFAMPVCELDLRPGGTCHYCLRSPAGHEMWGKWTFREVVAPERLSLVMSFSDAHGGITRHPMSPTWPQETLSTTRFDDAGDATTLAISSLAWNASEEEHRTFDAAHDGMRQGWAGTFDQLAAHLATTKD